MEQQKKNNYFKRLKMALLELENYIQFTVEKLGKAMEFLVKTIILLVLIIVISNVAYILIKFKTPANYVDSIIPEFSYENHNLVIETKEMNDNQKQIAEMMKQLEPTYRDLLADKSYNKSDVLNFLNSKGNIIIIYSSIFLFILEFFDLFIFWILVALITSLIGLIVLNFSRIKMKYSRLFSISIYASTLSMILNVIYLLLNQYFGIYIELFEYLSILIAYIYVTAVIYMIKSDLINQQMELIKIAKLEKIKKQQENANEEKEEKEKEEEKQEEKNGDKEEKQINEKNKENEATDEPDGSEI